MQTAFDDYDDYDTSLKTFQQIKNDIPNTRERVYQAIANNGGLTCKELAWRWRCSPNDISGRFTELLHDGRIIITGRRHLPNHKNQMTSNRIYEVVK